MSLPANFQQCPRVGGFITWEESGPVLFGMSSNVVLFWSVLEPLFELLFLPFDLRGRHVGSKSREVQLKEWNGFDALLKALGFTLSKELAVMRYGGGWHKLRSKEQLEAK